MQCMEKSVANTVCWLDLGSQCFNLLGFGSSDDSHLLTFDLREKLRVAVIKGDIDTVMRVFGSNPEAVDAILNEVSKEQCHCTCIQLHVSL